MSYGPIRPTVNVVKPRVPSTTREAEVILLITGVGGQRARIYLGPGDDVMRIRIEHEHHVEVFEPETVPNVRWPYR